MGHSTSTQAGHHRTADIYWAGLLLPEILMILFIQSTAVLQKYLNYKLNYFVCYNFSLKLHRIPGVFHVQRNPWVFQVFEVCGHPVQDISRFTRFSRQVITLYELRISNTDNHELTRSRALRWFCYILYSVSKTKPTQVYISPANSPWVQPSTNTTQDTEAQMQIPARVKYVVNTTQINHSITTKK